MSRFRRAGAQVVHMGWTAAFSVAGRVVRPRRVAMLAPQGGSQVAVVAAHRDDETIGCGSAIAQHLAAGDSVTVLVLTDGGRSRAASPDERAHESREAARALGGTWLFGAFREGEWND